MDKFNKFKNDFKRKVINDNTNSGSDSDKDKDLKNEKKFCSKLIFYTPRLRFTNLIYHIIFLAKKLLMAEF